MGVVKADDVNALDKLGHHDTFNQLTDETETNNTTTAFKLILGEGSKIELVQNLQPVNDSPFCN